MKTETLPRPDEIAAVLGLLDSRLHRLEKRIEKIEDTWGDLAYHHERSAGMTTAEARALTRIGFAHRLDPLLASRERTETDRRVWQAHLDAWTQAVREEAPS